MQTRAGLSEKCKQNDDFGANDKIDPFFWIELGGLWKI